MPKLNIINIIFIIIVVVVTIIIIIIIIITIIPEFLLKPRPLPCSCSSSKRSALLRSWISSNQLGKGNV